MDSRCFSKDFIIEFLRLYQSQPCLWKIRSKDYSNRNKKQEAYNVLVEKLKEVDKNASKDTVVKKIDSFRGSFRKEIRKIEEIKKLGSEEVYKPKLWYFDHLTFLCDQMTGKSNILDGLDDSTNEALVKVESNQYIDESSIDDIVAVDEPFFLPLTPTPPLTGAETSTSIAGTSFGTQSNTKRQADTCDEETLKKICLHLDKADSVNDEFSIMGVNVANKLRKLPPETVGVAEKLITDILFEAQCGSVNQFTRISLVDSRQNSSFI